MPRYVLINSQNGHFHGDTGRISGSEPGSPFDAALALDRALGRPLSGYGRARMGSRDATLDVYELSDYSCLKTDAS